MYLFRLPSLSEALRDEFLKSKKEGKDQKWEPVEENQ